MFPLWGSSRGACEGSKWNHSRQEEDLSAGSWSANHLEMSVVQALPGTETIWGGWNPHGQLWGITGPEMHPLCEKSHIPGDPHQLQLSSPSGDGWTQERTSGHGLKLERKCFTITPSQTESPVNLSNNLKLGNAALFCCILF